jgi:hypothetical protein
MKKRTPACPERRQLKRARDAAQHQEKKRSVASAQSRGKAVVCELFKTINHFFPDLLDHLRQIEDCRRQSDYELSEILMAAIALFIFQQGSRNALNNLRQEAKFAKHYRRLFKLRLPHLDTVHRVLCRLADEVLEHLKHQLVKTLLEKKALHKHRLLGRYFVVAIDATGMVSFAERHCDECLHQTSKTGKTTYFHNVLEAKLITANGFAISLATEWIVNPAGEYEKQDCERKAFVRLAAKLKQLHPRLPICLTADGLYPYQGFFDICHANQWAFILTFKDGNLPSVWQEVEKLRPLCPTQHRRERRLQGGKQIEQIFHWVTDIDYHGHRLQWLECIETIAPRESAKQADSRFVHLTNLEVTAPPRSVCSAPPGACAGRSKTKVSIPRKTSAMPCSTSMPGSIGRRRRTTISACRSAI